MFATIRHTRLALSLAAWLAAGATAAFGASSAPDSGLAPPLDQGLYVISAGGERLGTENFAFRVLRDSLCLVSQTTLVQRVDGRPDTVAKRVFMAVGKDDWMLHVYQSNQLYHGHELVRGVVMGDTLFTLYREFNRQGTGDRMVLPPGRIYVMDAQLFSLLDFLTLSLRDQTFDQRPVTILALGERDTLVEATLSRTGRDTLRSEGRLVRVNRMRLVQGPVTLELWVDDAGRLLRIAHPPTGMLVERESAAVKPRRRASPAAKRGG